MEFYMAIQFIDLKAQYKHLKNDIRAAMDAVLEHGRFIMGPEVTELEDRLALFTGSARCVSCSSGTDALLMALMAHGVGPGDTVATSPFTFIATAEVVSLLGARPIFVDVDPDTFNLDPAKLERLLQEDAPAPKAIIAVDVFGLPCDYVHINAMAERVGALVIQDAAQSFGAQSGGKRACSMGAIGCTSFFPAKPLGCYGDGGAVFTNDPDTAGLLESIRVHGRGTHKYDNARIGINGRLDTLQAAVLLVKLAAFKDELKRREEVARLYGELLSLETPELVKQHIPDGTSSAWAQYSVLLPHNASRQAFQGAMKNKGVPTAVYYPKPLHLQQAFVSLGHRAGDMPVAEDLAGRIVSLPMHPYLDESRIQEVVSAVKHALGKAGTRRA